MLSIDWYKFAIELPKNSTPNLRFICPLFSADPLVRELKLSWNFIIFQIAKVNKKPALLGQLVLEESTTSDSRGRIQDLFTSNRMRLTLQVYKGRFLNLGIEIDVFRFLLQG